MTQVYFLLVDNLLLSLSLVLVSEDISLKYLNVSSLYIVLVSHYLQVTF